MIADIIILAAVLSYCGFVLRRHLRNKKNGCGGCGGNCGSKAAAPAADSTDADLVASITKKVMEQLGM